ncbi:MAG TPA: transglutaminase domain-containing protein [Kofleriaceae bacterium]|nr:transglutaminase domain-containing protein [Kofleriaceae bacterium]
MRARAWTRVGAAVIVLACGGIALSAGDEDEPPPLLHEDLPGPGSDRPDIDFDQPLFGPDPSSGQNPAAFEDKGKILPEPSGDPARSGNEPVHGTKDFAADRQTETTPDRNTGPDGTLHYVTVFNPSVIPFKRMSSLDAVRDDYSLFSATSHTHRDLDVGGARSPTRDLFWGSLVVKLQTGTDIPIPSVSADMRILSYEVTPSALALTFSKDGADNYYVRTEEPGVSGEFRLVFLADADARYFGAPPPKGYRVYELPTQKDFPDLPALPSSVRSMADRGLQHLGVHRGMLLEDALDKLVYYFRAFEAKPVPQSGDIYWDLFISQAGVCRHRSFVFMITANALGLPTRYVTNEAHAFVEVWAPGAGWIRVDLGGAALNLEVSNGKDKTIYRPRHADTLPQPPEYADNYTQLKGDITGLSQNQIDESRVPHDPDQPGLSGDGDGDGDGDADSNPTRVGPGKSLPTLPPDAMANKRRTAIVVHTVDPVGFRGESLRVKGRLTEDDDGDPVPDQRIDVYFAPTGSGGDDAILVGSAVSDKDGNYSAEVQVPRDIELREYEVFAATPGDKKYSPAVSD